MFLIGPVSGLIARPRPPRGALSARFVSTAPASEGCGRRESVCMESREGGGEGKSSIRAAGRGWWAVKYGETEAEGWLIGVKSDTLI